MAETCALIRKACIAPQSGAPMAKKKTAIDFEKSLQTLEQLVESMEGGDMTLEKSLEAFEQGIKLTKECQQALREAQQKVDILLQQNGDEELTPFAEDDAD
tara:strand:+ start:372 stop:674 length:303 start_codon:yes stop_codon:yes gene_type:complete